MRKILFSAMLALSGIAVAPVTSMAADAPAAPKLSVESTDLGTLLDNPASKAVLMKYLPDLIGREQIQMARGLTLKQIQGYAPDMVPDDKLAVIQADLDKLPAK